MLNFGPYGKAILNIVISALGALAVTLTGSTDFSDISLTQWLLAGAAVLGSSGLVWLVENVPGTAGGAIKATVSFLSAGVASLVLSLDDNIITNAEWITALSAAIVATGFVYQAVGPNTTAVIAVKPAG